MAKALFLNWQCSSTDWSTPPIPLVWDAEVGDGSVLTAFVIADGFGWNLIPADPDERDASPCGRATTLAAAQYAAEATLHRG